jgi:hypothetical protein
LGDIAGLGGIDALEPGLGFAPPEIAADGDVNTVVMKHRGALDVARADLAVAVVAVDIFLGRFRVAVVPPDLLERGDGISRRSGLIHGFESVNDPVAAGEDDLGLAIHPAQSRGRPGAVENARADPLHILGDPAPGMFVEDDEAGGIGRADEAMGVIDAVAGVEIKLITVEQE